LCELGILLDLPPLAFGNADILVIFLQLARSDK